MKDYRTMFKRLANSKGITSSDMYAFALLRAFNIKSEITYADRVKAAVIMTKAAFTPISNQKKLYCSSMGNPYYTLQYRAAGNYYLWNCRLIQCLETSEEQAEVKAFSDDVMKAFSTIIKDKEQEDYCFVVVRTNMPRIQQAVQAAHATMQLGACLRDTGSMHNELNLVLCGVDGVPELNCLMDKLALKGKPVIPFYEPDMHNSLTAVATGPLRGRERDFLNKVKLLRL